MKLPEQGIRNTFMKLIKRPAGCLGKGCTLQSSTRTIVHSISAVARLKELDIGIVKFVGIA